MYLKIIGLILVASSSMAGCTTWMLGSAPAADGSMYVVGEEGNSPAMWKCSKKPGPSQCQEVKVEE